MQAEMIDRISDKIRELKVAGIQAALRDSQSMLPPHLATRNREIDSDRVALDLHAPCSISSPNLATLLLLYPSYTTDSTLQTL